MTEKDIMACIKGYDKEVRTVASIMAYGTEEEKVAKLKEYGLL